MRVEEGAVAEFVTINIVSVSNRENTDWRDSRLKTQIEVQYTELKTQEETGGKTNIPEEIMTQTFKARSVCT